VVGNAPQRFLDLGATNCLAFQHEVHEELIFQPD
jgi:hypothetical protein